MAHNHAQAMQAIRKQLSGLAGLKSKARAAEAKIQAAAEQRLAVVTDELGKLRPRALLDDGAAKRYEDLVLENGWLDRIMMGDEK